jgi:hypothetical protein
VDLVDVVTGAGLDVEDDGTVVGVVVTASRGVLVDVVVGAVAQVSIVMKGPPTRPRLSPLEVKTAVSRSGLHSSAPSATASPDRSSRPGSLRTPPPLMAPS